MDGSNGPLVVLIHGTLDRMSGMARLARIVAAEHSVLRFDRRGYGDSWDHPGPFTVAGNVDDVVALVGRRDAVLVGHSFGGNVALAAAARLGGQCAGVSVYETPVSWNSWWPTTSAGGRGIAAGPEMAAESFMVALIGEDGWRRLPERTKDARRREGRALVEELGTLRLGAPWTAELITCRVLVGRGSRASAHHVRGAEWIAESCGTTDPVVIDGAGHGAHMSHPAEFHRMLVAPHFRID
ncbi:MAG: alpha/beta fold hydrolase [Ilumatobacteraceae bacterium]